MTLVRMSARLDVSPGNGTSPWSAFAPSRPSTLDPAPSDAVGLAGCPPALVESVAAAGPRLAPAASTLDAMDLLDRVGEGLMMSDVDDRIVWVNERFVQTYRLADKAAAIGATLLDVYVRAWATFTGGERRPFAAGVRVLEQNLLFGGGAFELPLPGGRWVRVAEQPRIDGGACWRHVDATVAKRQQQRLLAAEQRARIAEQELEAANALHGDVGSVLARRIEH